MDIERIRAPIADDLQAVNALIRQQLHSDVVLINQLAGYIIDGGGKRLRPLTVLLSARACGYAGAAHINAAAIIEFIHTSTLLHDDVVDESSLRRGRETANAIWGNQASVLVGDFLYSRSFQMMVGIGSMRVMEILADTTNTIAEGEVLQLLNVHDPDTTEERYMAVIHCKTAKLFEAAAQLGAVLTDRPRDEELALGRYGMHLGTAFQLIDDVLDYSASSAELGKNIGDDLAEGKPTLPLIHAMRHGTPEEVRIIREAIEQGGLERIDVVSRTIESTGALDYTARLAAEEAERAITQLGALPDSPAKDALVDLARFSVSRRY
ncbi:MAG TPA: octaprenyl diphosphate synthase [Candidatus Competibacteraceae bacterium]|nr:octaprenyl diphosphate synthase [Candidatus Competibacteraceae bacterium]HQA26684.1 octaprenyl diphosphate synthase [Candidatus Competibacteraceae bacterium]HQD55888.1 octaprenyl diphosphate synthase [Candidatus Competibacteraceae bacterium]